MKKLFYMFIAIVFLSCLFARCTNANTPTLSLRSYELEHSDEPVKPCVSLQENNEFTFIYSALSSYIAHGFYKIDSDKLILTTDDKKYIYIFEIRDNTLLFDSEKSSALPSYAKIPDGAVFK